jgi:hypothetical protein
MKQIVPPAPPTHSHHDDRTPVIHTTAHRTWNQQAANIAEIPTGAERAPPRLDETTSALVSRFVGQIALPPR